MFRLCSALMIIGLLPGQMVFADSRCGFETGLLGSTAIGYQSPHVLAPYDRDENPYQDGSTNCAVLTFERPGTEGVLTDCDDLIFVPSRYVTDVYREGLSANPSASEYFEIQVFGVEGQFLKARLQDGGEVWVKHSGMVFAYQFDNRFPQNHRGIPWTEPVAGSSVSPLFLEPDLSASDPETKPAAFQLAYSEDWIAAHTAFFDEPVFDLLEALGRFDPLNIETHVNGPSYDSEFAVQYIATDFVRAPDGALWYQADEIMTQAVRWTAQRLDIEALDVPSAQKEVFMALLYSIVESEPLRQVYIPYRAPDGTILTVLSEAFCD
ncbi:MAG: hypothetical protein HRT81_08115 [Henriciella sp.]|nr:hypothetical protein [Henriciella sp.]